MMHAKIDPGLLQYATSGQLQMIEVIDKHKGNMRAASRELGLAHTTVAEAMRRLRNKAALQGYSPEHMWTRTVPDTHVAKGVSTYFKATETQPAQWVKADMKAEAWLEAMRHAAEAIAEGLPKLPPPPPPKDYATDVIPWIQIGDAHIGMLAHAEEVGEDFNLETAEAELLGAIFMLLDQMPPCERVVINDLGDMTHAELYTGKTAASGHDLDMAARYHRMIRTYSKVMRAIVDKALTKAKFVDVSISQGNHSRVNDLWMAVHLEAMYGHTGRVNVLPNHGAFICYRMGKTLVLVHHGDKCPPERLVNVMTSDYRRDFGETDYHYIDTGHVHSRKVAIEHGGVQLESWNVLQTNDKWANDAGYRSRRCLSVVLRSKTYGEIGRRTLSIQEVRDRLARKAPAPKKPAVSV